MEENELRKSSEINSKILILDKNSFNIITNTTLNVNEINIENIFDSIHQEDFTILKSEKYYAINQNNQARLINDDNLNIVSISFNKNVILYVKNNGECFICHGDKSKTPINFNLNSNILPDFNNIVLKNSLKITSNLNKKYLVKVACGKNHAIFLTHAGMVFSMGSGSKGQLGHGNTNDIQEPTMITPLLNYRIYDVAVGGDHNLALGIMRDLTKKSTNSLIQVTTENSKTTEQNFLYVWGDNSKGQLGLIIDDTQISSVPIINDFFSDKKVTIEKITCGIEHSLVLTSNGKLFGFGSNELEQINQNSEETKSYYFVPYRIRNKKYDSHQKVNKDLNKFILAKASSYSSMLISNKNILTINGKINCNCDHKRYNIKIFDKEQKQFINIKNLLNLDGAHQEINFIFNNNHLKILYDSQIYQIELEEYVEVVSYDEEDNININANANTGNANENEVEANKPINVYDTPDETGFLHDLEISKEFLSDNASTNELFDNNVSFEQTIEELRNYISLVGISYVGDPGNSLISFRPKNLPKKTPQEEYYHRQLVEQNRRRYIQSIKEKQEEERKIKERIDKKKLKIKKLQQIWEEDILPNWFKRKKDYNYMRKYFYDGVPTGLRGRVWLLSIGNNFSITREYYEIELKKAVNILLQLQKSSQRVDETLDKVDNESKIDSTPNNKYNIHIIDKEKSIKYIDLDIERTFPYLGIFKGNSPMGDDLREVLQAFVASRPDIGYVQGMSFIAGMLLMFMDKYQSFVALMNITLSHDIIPFYRFEENQIRKRVQIFKQIFYYNLPELCDHFESMDILPEHYLIEWYMTLFSKSLNIDISARIWDIYMIEGIKAIFQAAIVILSHFEKRFLDSEFDTIMKTLKTTNNINFDEDQFTDMMKQVKFQEWVSQEIQKLNDEYIPIY